jgi:hypothetical protein
MIKNIKLKEKDILFLKEVCAIDILAKYAANANFEDRSKSWIFLLASDDLESVSDELSDALMNKGVTNGEINSTGKVIEGYIDKFNYYE